MDTAKQYINISIYLSQLYKEIINFDYIIRRHRAIKSL